MRMTWKRWAPLLVALGTWALFTGGCQTGPDQDGHRGDVYVMVARSADVTAINVSSLGVPASPAQFTELLVDHERATISWTSGASYAATVNLAPQPGGKAKCKDDFPFKICENGNDGAPRTYLLDFSGNTVTVSLLDAVYLGVPF